jgi:hypothetical protein
MGGRRFLCAAIAGFAGLLAGAPATQASFHEISIREVYPGSLAQPESDYVVLQMYFGGQQFVAGQALRIYGSGGAASGTFTFPSSLPNGANQQTILVGDDGVGAAFGVTPDLVSSSFALDRAGGAACWAGSLDCVSWGSFAASTPSPAGTAADPLGIPSGTALRRTIAPGCPTLLELGDDSDDSAEDFADVAPLPRNNASAITEKACTGPATTIDAKPADPTNSTSASFTYHAAQAGASFECKLDTAAFAACPDTGIEYAGPLSDGQHTFQARAKSEAGTLGGPASYSWKVDTLAPSSTIDTKPTGGSPGGSVTFTFHASETGASFECSLVEGAGEDVFSACTSGKTYSSLADGEHTFKVRATDAATNLGAPASYTWAVDNTAADTTAPDTIIDSAPADPSTSPEATFTYHASEAGSEFECKLDGAAFAACPATGVTYASLANGSHTFQVRAIDASENVDPTPAGRTFLVAVPDPSSTGAPAVSPQSPLSTPAVTPAAPQRKRPRRRRCRRSKPHRSTAQAHALQRSGRRCKRGVRPAPGRATASSFHLVMLREIYPGSSASPNAEYVELQMYASSQEFVKGHRVEFFDSAGGSLGSVAFDADVARGASQSTLVIASPEAESQFGVVADKGAAGGKIDPAGGAVCWEALDCLAWGSFSGPLSSPAGSPADPLGIPDGMALRRTIAPGCPTLLESSDDRDDSATDFAEAFPAPRPNAVAPSERACASQGPGGGSPAQGDGGRRADRPQTKLGRRPARETRDRTPTFGFSSTRPGSIFLCKLDRRPFRRCRSPFTAPRLGFGPHVFRVKARAGGLVDASPASWRFEVTQHG